MKILDILLEKTDISLFGRMVQREGIPNIDRSLRGYLREFVENAKHEDPDNWMSKAEKDIKAAYEHYGGVESLFRQVVNSQLRKILAEYLRSEYGDTLHIGKQRIRTYASYVGIRFPEELEDAVGLYTGRKEHGRPYISVAISKDEWNLLAERWLYAYFEEEDTEREIEDFLRRSVTETLMHEVTHLVNDIAGDTHQNTALLKHGKAYNSSPKSKFNANVLHLSRTSEIQTFASEIAWSEASSVMADPIYKGNAAWAIETLDGIIDDLKRGYLSSTLAMHKEQIEHAMKTASAGEKKQLQRIWKKLFGQVIRNLELYKARLKREQENEY